MGDTLKGSYAVVTGASRGLGRSMALNLASRGINTLLISLPDEDVEAVSESCRQKGTISLSFEADLTVKSEIERVATAITEYDISILINNAGIGGTRSFLAIDPGYLDNMIDINVRAPVLLSRHLLPGMIGRKKAYILNVASMASFSPIGYKTVYPASKKFLQYFSVSLNEELRRKGVKVCVVHPMSMRTNSTVTRRIDSQGLLGQIGLLSPDRVAELTLRRMFRGKTFIVPGLWNGFNRLVLYLVPRWIKVPLLSRAFRREIDMGVNR
ncbi:MAG: SDR family NAD(P)-dependent oxidoreductase [Bacteroidales bacterium]|nr:SDR family NAD(P)-dependent oxidoreductase [Bacteroidales bacterium]